MAQERKALRKGETQTHPVEMRAGEFLRAAATQEGVDVELVLRDAGGKTLATVNRSIAEGLEELYWIAEAGGRYELAVSGAARAGAEGFYRLTTELRAAGVRERSCRRGFVAIEEARKLEKTQRAENRKKAMPLFEEALQEFVNCGSKGWEAQVLEEMGDSMMYMGERAKPLGIYRRGAALRRELGEERALGISLSDMGAALTDLGELKEAVALFDEALKIKVKFGDKSAEAITLNNAAFPLNYLGQTDKAIAYLERAIQLDRETGNRVDEANALSRLAQLLSVKGRFQEAIELLAQSLKIGIERNSPELKASAYYTLGACYSALGDYDRARQYWRDSAANFEIAGNKAAVATSHLNTGLMEARFGRYEAALASMERALEWRKSAGAKTSEGLAHVPVCQVLIELKRFDEAMAHGEAGIRIGREQGVASLLGASNRCMGKTSLQMGKIEKAREYLMEALRRNREAGDNRGAQANDLALLAEVERAAGRWPEALGYIEEATRMADAERAGVANPGLRATILAERSERISLHTDTLMRMEALDPEAGYAERAFALTELWRARNLVETLNGTAPRATLRPEQVKEERALLDRVTGLQRELFRPGLAAGRRKALKEDLTKAERELELFQAQTDGAAKAVDAKVSVEALRRQVGPETALVEFALGTERSYAFVLGTKGLKWFALAARKEIEPVVDGYRRRLVEKVSTLTAGASLRRADADGAALYRMLLGPLEGALAGKAKVVIVADGLLHYLPFEALPSGKGRVVERWSVSYAPSAMALASLQERRGQRAAAGKTLLAMGDAVYGAKPASLEKYVERGVEFQNLPQTRAEVLGLRDLYPAGAARVLLGAEATEAQLKKADIGAYRYLHFAAHGYYDEEEPRRSGIVLGPGGAEDGILQASEISRMQLNAEMVTLSACQTGLGKLLAGEGVMGLTRAFFSAGAQSVVASLWNVNDSATAELMKRFYGNLNRGMERDRALREAKLAMIRTPGTAWQHPYYWAPFVLLGDTGAGR